MTALVYKGAICPLYTDARVASNKVIKITNNKIYML